jgi:hypothetical protein
MTIGEVYIKFDEEQSTVIKHNLKRNTVLYKKKKHSEDQGVGGRMGSEWFLGRLAGGWIGLDWLRIGAGGGL